MAARRRTRAELARAQEVAARAVRRFERTPLPRTRQEWAAYDRRRSSIIRLLEEAGRKPASIRATLGWITRRQPSPPTRAQVSAVNRARARFESLDSPRRWWRAGELAEYERRRAALLKALTKARRTPASIRATLGAITRRKSGRTRTLADVHAALFDGDLNASRPDDRRLLRTHHERRSRIFRRYIARAMAEGLDYDSAIDSWYSPEAIE